MLLLPAVEPPDLGFTSKLPKKLGKNKKTFKNQDFRTETRKPYFVGDSNAVPLQPGFENYCQTICSKQATCLLVTDKKVEAERLIDYPNPQDALW